MSTFGTFLLAVAAFIGTVMIFTDPSQKLIKAMEGKKTSELTANIKRSIKEEPGKTLGQGCSFLFFLLLSIFYTFVVEPLGAISALVNKLGYQPLAYAVLAIIALEWVIFAHMFTNKKKTETPQGTIITTQGETIAGTVINIDEEVKLGNPTWRFIRRIFFSIPTVYLWYVFLVAINIAK